jgi:uncharacterized HhH-GPD family protein
MATLQIAQVPEADRLLSTDPLALLLGMLYDQQFPMERAFAGPYVLAQRIGVTSLDATALAALGPDTLIAAMATTPVVHRYPKAMAERTQAVCRILVAEYDGSAATLWETASSGAELLKRLTALPGFGKQKAQIFTALLAKQLGVRPDGWETVVGDYALDGYRSVADVIDPASLQKVRDFKQQKKAAAKAAQATA